jgi:hypothetical protein
MGMPEISDPVCRYYELLIENPEGINGLFEGLPTIDHPEGRFVGSEARDFIREKSLWLLNHDAHIDNMRLIRGRERNVCEVTLLLIIDGATVDLPVAVVGERGQRGRLASLRVYHSTWPLTNSHIIRRPLFKEDPDIEYPDIVAAYQRALAHGDLEGILDVFEEGACAREPSGQRYRYCGKERLRQLYGGMFAVGGFPFEHCMMTDDGVCCAVEYNVVQWGERRITPQAGIAVYERGRSGKLIEARIYDDVAIEEGGTSPMATASNG